MNSSGRLKITGLAIVLAMLPASLYSTAQQIPATSGAPGAARRIPATSGAPAAATTMSTPAAPTPAQQLPPPSEGQALHILVGKSVVVNVQTPITRVLSSNPAVIETLAAFFRPKSWLRAKPQAPAV